MRSALPFDDFRNLFAALPGPDADARQAAAARLDRIAPGGGLGALGDLVVWHAAWSGRTGRPLTRPLVAIFAGNHGVALRDGVPAPPKATADRVADCASGAAAVAQICSANDLGLKLFDLALDHPTGDFGREAALEERDCAATMAFGMEAIAGGVDLIALAGIGAGGAVACRALITTLLGPPENAAGGGQSDPFAETVLGEALALHGRALSDPLEALRRLGGRETAAIAGAILAARMERVPVVLGGLSALAAAAVLWKADPGALDHVRLADRPRSAVACHAAQAMGLAPMLDLRLGDEEEASAALGAALLRSALACHGAVPAPANPVS